MDKIALFTIVAGRKLDKGGNILTVREMKMAEYMEYIYNNTAKANK
jgi:hypothetical protein